MKICKEIRINILTRLNKNDIIIKNKRISDRSAAGFFAF